jgi:hypothetical protein
MKRWSSVLAVSIFFCLLIGCATHRAKRDLIVLLPDPDGKDPAITVTTKGGSQILDKPGYATEVEDLNKAPIPPRPVNENEIKKRSQTFRIDFSYSFSTSSMIQANSPLNPRTNCRKS